MTDETPKKANVIRLDAFKLRKGGLDEQHVEKALAAKDAGLHHEFKLRSLGFPDEIVKEALAAEKKGLNKIKPPPDSVDRIMERCKPHLPKPKPPEHD